MRLIENLILRSYHLFDYDWTPLSRNPCWLCSVAHHSHCYMMITRFCRIATILFMLVNSYHEKTQFCSMRMINLLQTTYLNPGIVSAESSLCATIHWGSSCVCLICVDWLLPPVNILYINYDLTLDGRADLQFNYFTPMNSMNLMNLMNLMTLMNLIN